MAKWKKINFYDLKNEFKDQGDVIFKNPTETITKEKKPYSGHRINPRVNLRYQSEREFTNAEENR